MYLERERIQVTWGVDGLLQLMTLRMNMRLSEGNALQSVPALPANDHLHLKPNHYPVAVLLYIFFTYVLCHICAASL